MRGGDGGGVEGAGGGNLIVEGVDDLAGQGGGVGQANVELGGGELIQVGVGDADVDDVGADVGDVERKTGSDGALDGQVPLLHVAGSGGAGGSVDALAEAGLGSKGDGGNGGSGGELEGLGVAVLGALLDVLDEGILGGGEWSRDAGLIDEDDAEAGAEDGSCIGREGEAQAWGEAGVVKLAGAAGVAYLTILGAEVVKLLGGQVEDGTLVAGFGGRQVEGVTRAEVEDESRRDAVVILEEELVDVVAGADGAGLKVDGEGVHLAEEEAGEGVAARGLASGASGIGACGSEGEGAGGIGGRDGVQLVAAEVGAGFDGVRANVVNDRVDQL